MLKTERYRHYLVKKRKHFLVLALTAAAAAALFAFSPPGRNLISAYREDAVMLKLIRSSGAELKSINITGWVRADQAVFGSGDPEVLADSAARQLKVPPAGQKKEKWQNQYARGAKIEGKLADGRTISILGQAMELSGGEKASHLMVSINGVESRKTGFYKNALSAALGLYGAGSRVAVTYAGEIKGESNKEELLAKAVNLMLLAGAPVREMTARDNLVSLTGYSGLFSAGISSAGQEVNLNVALRYNPVEQVTLVFVASPVILTEY